MIMKIKYYFFIAVGFALFHQVTLILCPKWWEKCGGSFCCCKGSQNAVCNNKNLTYIPKLPKGIRSLSFRGNDIKDVSAETFYNVTVSTIEILGLLSNGIENIHHNTFTNFSMLQKLILKENPNLNWSQFKLTMHSMPYNINSLNLDNTGIRSLPGDIFEGLRRTNVQFINLQKNEIQIYDEKAFYELQTLKTLDLSNNRIEKINDPRLGHRNLERLSLAKNDFSGYAPLFCSANSSETSLYPRLASLDLTGNAISILSRRAWSCLWSLRKLFLAQNIIKRLQNDIFADLRSLEILHVSYMAKPIQEIEPKAFHNLNMRELHFDNNRIDFKPDSNVSYTKLFTFCPKVTKLLIGFNYFRTVWDSKLVEMLSPLTHLTELHLDGARLYKIPENLLNKFINLTKLYMESNKIEFIDPGAFINVSKLEVLHLASNKIKVVNDTFPIALRKSLREINLALNPLYCSFCAADNNTWFRYWIDSSQSKIKFVGWPSYYRCASPPSELGSAFESHKPTEKDCEIKDPMFVAYITIGVSLFVFIVFGYVGYRGRWYIRFWTIKLQRKWNCGAKNDPERERLLGERAQYDAFVIYHANDRAFVRNKILTFMEKEHNYKLFIWDRDFTAGDQTVGIVVDNIYKSNHVIAMISKSFMKDQWCDFQLAVSLDRQIELKKNFLTLITLEDVDKKLLNKTWCVLLTKTTTADWCDKENDIRKKLFEHQILSSVPCMSAR